MTGPGTIPRARPWTAWPRRAGAPRPDADGPPGAGFDPVLGKTGAGPSVPDWVVQQWLERVDADPGRLLRNQFKVEESRVEERTGGALVEPRPW